MAPASDYLLQNYTLRPMEETLKSQTVNKGRLSGYRSPSKPLRPRLASLGVLALLALCCLPACKLQPIKDNGSNSFADNAGSAFPRSESGLLAYANYLQQLSGPQLRQEQQRARQALNNSDEAYNVLRLALSMMASTESTRDQRHAQSLLHNYLDGRPSTHFMSLESDYRDLAKLLLNHLDQQQKLIAERSSLAQKLEQLMLIESSLGGTRSNTVSTD